MNEKALAIGILLLLGGILLAYWGYFLQPELFLYSVGMAGIGGLILPLIIIFLGVILTWYGSTAKK